MEMTTRRTIGYRIVASALVAAPGQTRADLLEMLNGQRIKCEVVNISDRDVSIKIPVGHNEVQMKLPLSKVYTITVGGERRVINARRQGLKSGKRPVGERPQVPDAGNGRPGKTNPRDGKSAGGKAATRTAGMRTVRSRAEVLRIIDQAGKSKPEWWDTVTVDYPGTLDFTWPKPPRKVWNRKKYIPQYIISVVNPNPGRWKSAVKMLHHSLEVNRNNRVNLGKTMERLAHVYGRLLGDYARSAFWTHQALKYGARVNGLNLADCYWKLGNKEMAVSVLSQLGRDRTGHGSIIKLWAEIGEFRKAIQLAETKARTHFADVAFLTAGGCVQGLWPLQGGHRLLPESSRRAQ